MKKPKINRDKAYSSSEIIKILEADGWRIHKAEGSHHQFKHPTKKGKVTIQHPDKDIPGPTVKAIWAQAGLI